MLKYLLIGLFMLSNAYASSRLNKVYTTLKGSFSSAKQSVYHPKFFDVTVRHCPISILDGNPNSKYLILRQSIAKYYNSPYRVRLVELVEENGVLKSKNYLPARDLDIEQFCDNASIPALYTSDFEPRAKCVLTLSENGSKGYLGTTGRPGCPSRRNGASYVTSEVEITDDYFTSLDRGWDKNGNQVWGSSSGPYVFEKTDFEAINPKVTELASMLKGGFSNRDQHIRNKTEFSLVSNKTCPVKIDGPKESGVFDLITNQRIETGSRIIKRTSLYRVRPQDKNQVLSEPTVEVYSLSGAQFEDYCSDKAKWNTPQVISLANQPCTISFQQKMVSTLTRYEGKTPQGGCSSSFRGASTLVIDELIDAYSVKVWERWLDLDGNQVAGSTKGFYEYQKIEDYAAQYLVK
jgi:CpeT protein